MTGSRDGAALVRLSGITKRYGDLLANDAVDLTIERGEIHALLGENGAGKSTLVKILGGVLAPTAGEIVWKGRLVAIGSPVAARRLGIGMVFQHFAVFEQLSVAENVAAALGPSWSSGRVRARLEEVGRTYGLALEADRVVATLSAGERQRIEIVRCLLQEPELIVLDEPTSVLTPQESERLFETLDRLAAEGRSILYISHRLNEVRRLARRATILRGGRVVAAIDPREKSAAEIAALMVGAEVGAVAKAGEAASGPPGLTVRDLSLPAEGSTGLALEGIGFEVRSGEIVGFAGIAGNGQGELFAAVSGERLAQVAEAVGIAGRPCGRLGIDARRRLGAAFVPEERLGHGAVPGHRLSENALLSHHAFGRLARAGLVDPAAARALAAEIVRRFDVRGPGDDPKAGQLSGGNLQKFLLGREIVREPAVLVVNQPTWGVDAGAARLIRQALVDLARRGAAVLIISQDLDELFEIADRIGVMHHGRLGAVRATSAWTREAIGLEMMAAQDGSNAARAA